jgi:hypothetical protein
VELDVSAGQVPVGVDNTVFYAFTAITGEPIPIATGLFITPGFELGSRVTISSTASKSPGLNGSASWAVHAGTGSNPGLLAGFSWSVSWPSITGVPNDPVFSPIGSATPSMNVGNPYFNGLSATKLDAKISLVPQIQFNLTVGITDPVAADGVMPFSFSPTVYLDMQTGDPGTTPPSGVSAHCPDTFDTWFALLFGSDLDLAFGGLTITVTDVGSKTVAAPTATVLPLATPAPLPGDGTSGCVSKTWVPPHPPAPPSPPSGSSSSGGGSSGALIGGIIGGVIALAIAGGAAYYFLVLKRGKGEDSGDYAAVALN